MGVYSYFYSLQYIYRQKFINWLNKGIYNEVDLKTVSNPHNILVICTGLLGDSVMSSPVFPQLRKIYPNSKIIFLGKKTNCELFYSCPFIDEFKITPVIPFTLFHRAEEKKLLEWLKSKKIDLAIVLLGAQFGKILKDAKIPIRVCTSIKGANLPNLYTHLYQSRTPKTWGPNEQLNSLRCLGHNVPFHTPKLWINEITINQVKKNLLSNGIQFKEKFVILHPFGSTKRQWWDLDNVSALVEDIYTKFKMKTLLIGGLETKGLISSNDYLLDFTGTLSINELISVIHLSEILITTDSGPFHIAGALNKNIIGLFRSVRPEFKNLYTKSKIILGHDSSCLNKCKWDKCYNTKCQQMKNIDPKQVTANTYSLLNLS